MTTYDADGITLHKLREHVWEIPQDETEGMRAPARVLASEKLLDEISDDMSLQQLKNATHLPGIQKYAIAMPDAHQGYGFPVGGVGATDAETGCISPGAVGFDINCLTGDTEVLLSNGRRRRLEELAADFESERAHVAADGGTVSDIGLFTETESREVFEVETKTGDTIRATGDHPLRTPDGMRELSELEEGDEVLLHPFEGFEHEEPPERVLIEASDLADADDQLVSFLQDRDLLPLKTTDEAFKRLLKLVGFHTGDGSFSDEQSWFYGDPEDLETIREDIEALGFTPSPIYERDREHDVGGNSFERTEYSMRASSRAFKRLLTELGAPAGSKVESTFTTPEYLEDLPSWQQALYLSAFFGAEMSAPDSMTDKNLYCPSVSHNRGAGHVTEGEQFMQELKDLLSGLGIRTNAMEYVERYEDHGTVRMRFGLKNDSRNLIRFFTRVGYRYNRRKHERGLVSAQYLKLKEENRDRRAEIAAEAKERYEAGAAPKELKQAYSDEVNERFIERSCYSGRSGRPRPSADFPGYDEFVSKVSVTDSLEMAAEIRSIESCGVETVYDIGVTHDDHTFVANGFVVSNCGVRMMKTDLRYEDVHGREEELVDALFENVPSGLGGGGIFEGTVTDVDRILEYGVEWALENDWAVPDDLAHCEDEGRRTDAEPGKVPTEAKERGSSQVGSLGSGNHFLEVQRVTDVFREDVADEFGLVEDQVVVLIHCGSRGLGHQTCQDYVRDIEKRHSGFVSQLPDKDLAAAPAGSQLAEDYYGAMCAAINFAWVNRQLIMHRTRQVFEDVFDRDWEAMEMELLYDVAHNIAKKEVHDVDGEEKELFVHRKGATRAFPAGRPELPAAYSDVGQPVIIPGSMGAGSYVLRGGENSLAETFGSTAHGAGRLMSRTQAKQDYWGGDVQTDLREHQQVYVKAQSGATIAEEAPGVYKDVDEVVRVSDALGIGDRVARTFPVCNVKG